MIRNYRFIFIGLVLLVIMVILWATTQGTADISMSESFNLLLNKIPIINNFVPDKTMPGTYNTIIFNVRLPRIILAFFVGAGLSISGTVFQGVFKNPMADPYVLGISSGAALGVTLATVLGVNGLFFGVGVHRVFAFGIALLTVWVVFRIASIGNKVPPIALLLAGIAINYFLSAIITLLMILHREHLEKIFLWTLGSFSTASWNTVFTTAIVVIIGSVLLYFFAKDLDIMLVGEKNAKSLGLEVEKIKKVVLVIASFMVSIMVATSGIIGFVGLIIPHITRFLVGPSHKKLMPFALIIGGIFMIFCDTLARSIMPPREISVGIITSLFGVPFFVYLLYHNKKKVS